MGQWRSQHAPSQRDLVYTMTVINAKLSRIEEMRGTTNEGWKGGRKEEMENRIF